MEKYSKKITLTAVEISEINMCLREALLRAKRNKNTIEYVQKIKKLQQKFQRLAVAIEKEVLQDIQELNNS